MAKLKAFLKKNILWVGFVAVVVPLLIILSLQYRSLVELERTSAVAHKVALKNSLEYVASEVQNFYQLKAGKVLDGLAGAIADDGSIKADFQAGKSWKGARRLFIVSFPAASKPVIHFVNPATGRLELEQHAPESHAVWVAYAPYKRIISEGSPVEATTISADERDPNNRILLKPLTNDAARVVGIAGLIVDQNAFKDHYLPQAINKYLASSKADDVHKDLVVAAYDQHDKLLWATRPLTKPASEVSIPLQFIFSDWRLSVQNSEMTPEQWAHSNFAINFSLLIVMTLVLLAGIILALRAASREIRLSQMKTDFVSNVSHELRTPLASIRCFGEFLKLGRVKEPEKVREYGEYIETESRRLTQLINNILDFAKIESAQKKYRFEQVQLAETVSETLKVFEVRLKQDGFTINYEGPVSPLPPVVIDANAITQALINLLDNAVKYSGTAREISVQLARHNDLIAIAVTDYGIGIPAQDQEKIFDKFYRVSTGLVHDVKGSGLGLSIVRHIVEAHQGKVLVQSAAGQGSTFTIYLPIDARLDTEAEAPRKPLADNESPLGLGLKI